MHIVYSINLSEKWIKSFNKFVMVFTPILCEALSLPSLKIMERSGSIVYPLSWLRIDTLSSNKNPKKPPTSILQLKESKKPLANAALA